MWSANDYTGVLSCLMHFSLGVLWKSSFDDGNCVDCALAVREELASSIVYASSTTTVRG